MFEHLKVEQNSVEKLLVNNEKDVSKNPSAKTGSDFFAMLMVEQTKLKGQVETDYRQTEQERDLTRDNLKDNQPDKISDDEIRTENAYNENVQLSKDSENKDAESLQYKHIDETNENKDYSVKEQSHEEIKETVKEQSSSLKEVNDKKNNKLSEEEQNIIQQLQSESSIKKLMEIIKAILSGDKKSEDENYKKLFSSLKFNNTKSNKNFTQSDIKSGTENHKNPNDVFTKITKEFKELISRELSKAIEDRKTKGKQHDFSDRELKDIASNSIEGIKKNRGREIVRHELKAVTSDDLKNDKKNINTEQQVFKKVELSDSSHFEKFSSGDKNSDRENFNYNSSKMDFSSKTGLHKAENTMKMLDFRENLQEIIDKAKITIRDSRNGSFTVKLNPQELGNVNVNLIMKNGIITGKFLVDNEDVKNVLLNNLQELKFQLQEAGIEVGEFSVGVDSRHERNFNNGDEMLVFPVFDSDREINTASQVYDSITETHIGHINMII